MIYRSNLACPDLTPYFKHLTVRPMPHSFGHDVPSDWADKADDDPVFGIYKRCGMWTHDEAAILGEVVSRTGMQAGWIDIGAHTGWTSKHINWSSNSAIMCVDPMLAVSEFRARFLDNTGFPVRWIYPAPSSQFFHHVMGNIEVRVCVDGDHSEGKPLEDATSAAAVLAETGVIIFHDGVGRPVREAVEYLQSIGFNTRAYFTPHLVFCCWRGDFTPPDHVPDPLVKAAHLHGRRYPDFDFRRCQ